VRDVRARVVVSNPPYIAYREAAALPASVRDWEPTVALFSGSDGMGATVRLVREAARSLGARGLLAIEVDMRRASLVAELVATMGAYEDVRVQLDLTGRERFVVARRREALE
jgi:release factor glutamine methyltransferase